jgi:uncharacterized protein
MSGSNSVVTRVLDAVFPIMPDFYGMINEQCDIGVRAMNAFVRFMETGSEEMLNEIRNLEKEADAVKARNVENLFKAFATPMDREDINRAILTIDYLINYTKITAREMGILHSTADKYLIEMAVLMKEGMDALQRGYSKLAKTPAAADEDASIARAAERKMEQTYRRALAELYDPAHYQTQLNAKGVPSVADGLDITLEILRTREIYRDMYIAADQLLAASGVLHDIVVKIA